MKGHTSIWVGIQEATVEGMPINHGRVEYLTVLTPDRKARITWDARTNKPAHLVGHGVQGSPNSLMRPLLILISRHWADVGSVYWGVVLTWTTSPSAGVFAGLRVSTGQEALSGHPVPCAVWQPCVLGQVSDCVREGPF